MTVRGRKPTSSPPWAVSLFTRLCHLQPCPSSPVHPKFFLKCFDFRCVCVAVTECTFWTDVLKAAFRTKYTDGEGLSPRKEPLCKMAVALSGRVPRSDRALASAPDEGLRPWLPAAVSPSLQLSSPVSEPRARSVQTQQFGVPVPGCFSVWLLSFSG